jgi:hypothetical protein
VTRVFVAAFIVLVASGCGGSPTSTNDPPAPDVLLVDFPPPTDASSGDLIERGFYHPAFPGRSLTRVVVWLSADTQGTYTLTMTARRSTYDGPLLGSWSTSTALSPGALTLGAFQGGPADVTPGAIVTFALTSPQAAERRLYYSVSLECFPSPTNCTIANPLIQTDGTSPPLDELRRKGVHARIYGHAPR